jgi:hypothetical protein
MSIELIKLPRSGAVSAEATDQAGTYRSNESNQLELTPALLHAVAECAFESMV